MLAVVVRDVHPVPWSPHDAVVIGVVELMLDPDPDGIDLIEDDDRFVMDAVRDA